MKQKSDIENESLNDITILKFRNLIKKFKYMEINDINNNKQNNKVDNIIPYDLRYPKSSSYFKKIHHHKMHIIIKNVTDQDNIIEIKHNIVGKNKVFDEILYYYRNYKKDFIEKQSDRYVNKINEIIKNAIKKKSYESIVDDFVRILFEISGLDDGKKLKIQSQHKLYLKLGTEKVTSTPDIICKTNNDVIWMVEESKHINNSTYLEGDLQLICHIFSAFQYNKEKNNIQIMPKSIFGFKIKNTKCFFYRIDMSDDYMICLNNNNFNDCIIVYKYPEKGIDINPHSIYSYDNIKKVFNILYNLKMYAESWSYD